MITWKAVALGAAAGLLSTVVAGFLFAFVLSGMDDPSTVATVAAAATGLLVAGWPAGRFAPHHGPLHGSLAGLATVVVVATDALLRGSNASPVTLFIYAALAAALGALGGRLGARSR